MGWLGRDYMLTQAPDKWTHPPRAHCIHGYITLNPSLCHVELLRAASHCPARSQAEMAAPKLTTFLGFEEGLGLGFSSGLGLLNSRYACTCSAVWISVHVCKYNVDTCLHIWPLRFLADSPEAAQHAQAKTTPSEVRM